MTRLKLGVASGILMGLTACGGGSGSSDSVSVSVSGVGGSAGIGTEVNGEPGTSLVSTGATGAAFPSGPAAGGGPTLAAPVAAPAAGTGVPRISGTPDPSVRAGADYAFQPVASDADSDRLAFMVTNLPAWAAFDATTGRISGAPRPNDKGVYGPITIAVSDGISMVSLPAFAITVDPPGQDPGKLKLAWRVPDRNEDGSVVQQPPILRIHYGRHSRGYDQAVTLPEKGQSRYEFTDLEPGTWYLAMTSIGPNGLEGELSEEMVVNIL